MNIYYSLLLSKFLHLLTVQLLQDRFQSATIKLSETTEQTSVVFSFFQDETDKTTQRKGAGISAMGTP